MRRIEKVEPMVPRVKLKKKVAAYARVSMETERLMHSLSAQVSHYSKYIQKNPEWEYAGVYSDDGISGTGTKKRKGFQQLIADAEDGKIDIIKDRFIRSLVVTEGHMVEGNTAVGNLIDWIFRVCDITLFI